MLVSFQSKDVIHNVSVNTGSYSSVALSTLFNRTKNWYILHPAVAGFLYIAHTMVQPDERSAG